MYVSSILQKPVTKLLRLSDFFAAQIFLPLNDTSNVCCDNSTVPQSPFAIIFKVHFFLKAKLRTL